MTEKRLERKYERLVELVLLPVSGEALRQSLAMLVLCVFLKASKN